MDRRSQFLTKLQVGSLCSAENKWAIVFGLNEQEATVLKWNDLHHPERCVTVPTTECKVLGNHCDSAYYRMLTASRKFHPSLPPLDFELVEVERKGRTELEPHWR